MAESILDALSGIESTPPVVPLRDHTPPQTDVSVDGESLLDRLAPEPIVKPEPIEPGTSIISEVQTEDPFEQYRDMDWTQVASESVNSFFPSMGRNIMDVVRLAQPFEGVFADKGTGKTKPFRFAPNVQELVGLLGELGVAGAVPVLKASAGFFAPLVGELTPKQKSELIARGAKPGDLERRPTAGEIRPNLDAVETPRLDIVWKFYRENLGLDDEAGIAGLKRFIATDPFGLLTDASAILSLGAGIVAKGSKVAGAVSQTAAAARLQRSAAVAKLLPKLNATAYLMKLERGASKAATVLDLMDPFALTVKIAPKLLEVGAEGVHGLIAGPRSALDVDMIDLERKYDMDFIASQKTTAPQVALYEGWAVKAGNEKLRLKGVKVEEDLTNIVIKSIDDLGGTPDLSDVGSIVSERSKEYRKSYEEFANELYTNFEEGGGLDLPASTDTIFATLSDIAERKKKVIDELRNEGVAEGMLTTLESVRDQPRLKRDQIILSPVETLEGKVADIATGGGPDRVAFGKDVSKRYRMRYKLADLDDLIPSQLDNFTDNPEFPQELQPRDRTRLASQLQVADIAQKLTPDALLTDIPTLNHGAPIVGADNFVESGNARVLALRRVRDTFPEKFAGYQQRLRAVLPGFGINPSVADTMRNPILVRENRSVKSLVDRVAFVREVEGGLPMSSLEVAFDDALALSDDTLGALDVGLDETIFDALSKPKNNEFITRFAQSIPAGEGNSISTAEGALSRAGMVRIKNAILSMTYGNGMLGTLVESIDIEGFKNLEKALLASLPEMSKSEGLIRAGLRAGDLSIAEDVTQAVNKFRELKAEKTSVSDFMLQGVLIADDLSDAARQILPVIEKFQSSPKKLAAFLKGYAAEVGRQPNPLQSELVARDSLPKQLILAKLVGETFDEAPDISDLLDQFVTLRQGVDEAVTPTVGAVEPAGPWTFDHLKQNRTAIGEKMLSNDPVATSNKRLYRSIYAALSADKNITVSTHAPELKPVIDAVEARYREGITLMSSKIARRIWAQKNSPSAIPPLILSRQTSIEDVGRMRELVGDESWKSIKAFTVNTLLERSLNVQGNWKPSGLHSQMKSIGKGKLTAILGRELVEQMEDVAEISASFGRLKKITEGSQTAFLNYLASTGVVAAVAAVYGGGIPGAAVFISSVVGERLFRNWIASDGGQAFLMGEPGFVGKTASALGKIPLPATRAIHRAGRIAGDIGDAREPQEMGPFRQIRQQ